MNIRYAESFFIRLRDKVKVTALALLLITANSMVVAQVNFSVPWEADFNFMPQDANGWTIIRASSDSRIIYVSSSDGNDSTAQVYSASSPEIGADVVNPVGTVRPYATIASAMAQARQGFPDLVLLKRGDVWISPGTIVPKQGRSVNERSIIAYYGTSIDRPELRTGTTDGVNYSGESNFSALIGIKFYAHTRDPNNPAFVGHANTGRPRSFDSGNGSDESTQSILIEDCSFDHYREAAIQGRNAARDFIIRRSIISNSYSGSSRSQGLYVSKGSILLEENVFDHNGWLIQQRTQGGNDTSDGQATLYNHHTYFTDATDVIMRKNIFTRASSISNKFTSNPMSGTDYVIAQNILLDNNLYVEGEVGVTAGGNSDNDNGPRWAEMYVINNVMMHLGRSQPTNRALAWGITVSDWQGGAVRGNIFKNFGGNGVTNVYAISSTGHTTNVDYTDNKFYNLTRHAVMFSDPVNQRGIQFRSNEIQNPDTGAPVLNSALTGGGMFSDNTYYSPSSGLFRVADTDVGFATWVSTSGESSSTNAELPYVDADRTIETYASTISVHNTLEGFVSEAKKQSKYYWRPAYTAEAVNKYIRDGFCLQGEGCDLVSPPLAPTMNRPVIINN